MLEADSGWLLPAVRQCHILATQLWKLAVSSEYVDGAGKKLHCLVRYDQENAQGSRAKCF